MRFLYPKAINISKVVLTSAIGFSLFLSSCAENINVEEQSLTDGWQIISSTDISADGKALSSGEVENGNWVKATVPTTVLGALVEADVYKDPFYAKNLADIPSAPFENPWWFRTEFSINDFNANQEQLRLFIDGINYRANFWLNGVQIASQDTLFGAFRQFVIDITKEAQSSNILAVEVIPPKVRDFYMGFVDWAPTPPDHYMGIYREIRVKRTGKVALDAPFVKTDVNLKTLTEADISFSAELTNFSNQTRTFTVSGTIEDVKVSKEFTLQAKEKSTVWFKPSEFAQLNMKNPRLWWSNGLGNPDMYVLNLQIHENGVLLDEQNVDFGIRTIETYLNDSGARGYKLNGREVLMKSGGWVDDLFLRYNPEKDKAQLRYVKEMNMNSLRFEGFWGNSQHIYDLCDKNGILVMVGWSCQWEWPDYLGLELVVSQDYDESMTIAESTEMNGVKLSSEEEDLLNDYLKHQVKWLRNHPSIFCWAVGSDAMPKPSLEKMYHNTLNQFDDTRSLLLSAGGFESEISGPSGMKMFGPYEYVPPVYWFEDDSKYGGAYGFNSETGPGPQIPPIGSIKKMIPEEYLWPPANDMWNYHSGRKDFNSVKVYLEALNNKYGEPQNLEELTLKAQLMNYEAMRPMFEAHVINRKKATGVVQWMLNSPWPEFYWQLYDYYLMPTGAYFGTMKAGQPATLIYNYHDHKVYASNDDQHSIKDYEAHITLYDINSKVVFETRQKINLGENDFKVLIDLPALMGKNKVYFLDMKLKNASGKLVSDNFYWLASKRDLMAWDEYVWFYTPQKQYADFNEINSMEKVNITAEKEIIKQDDEWEVKVTLNNPSEKLAFFIELNAVNKSTGSSILPVFWSDNYVSLAPGESKILNLKFDGTDLNGDELEIKIQGINLKGEMKI